MALALRRHALFVIVVLAITVVSIPLVAQSRPVAAATPVGQLSIAGGPPVPIYAFGFGATATLATGGSGGGAVGKTQLSDVSFVKQADALSAAMFRNVVTGTRLPSVRVEIFQRGSSAVGSTFQLSDVVVTAFQVSGGDGVESVSLAFERITLTVAGQSFCWDAAAQVGC